jgi:hypothetical protein
MLWLGLIIGLVLGGSFGVVIAVLLLAAKAGHRPLRQIARADAHDSISRNNSKTSQKNIKQSKRKKEDTHKEPYDDITC